MSRWSLPESIFAAGSSRAACALPLGEICAEEALPVATGVSELDRVLAGGLVPGSVSLVAGEPGIGKSTLLLQALAGLALGSRRSLLVAAEETASQVAKRAARLKCSSTGTYVIEARDLGTVFEAITKLKPDVVVVDSIQGVEDPTITSHAGSTTQVRACAGALAGYAKATGTTVVLVGHVTKDGGLAGPRALEHLVDTVLSFEGDRHHALRLLSAIKHRFGPAGELGLFEMDDQGLRAVEDPSRILLAGRRGGVAGTAVVPVTEGRRPLLVELQALVTEATGQPRRVVEGLPPQRLALMLAIIERSLGIPAGRLDVFVSTVGAIKITEPASDLALGLAVVSAVTGVGIPGDVVVFGEVGLTGELRPAPRAQRRLSESARLGFRRAVVAFGSACEKADIELCEADTITAACELVQLPIKRHDRLGAGCERLAAQ